MLVWYLCQRNALDLLVIVKSNLLVSEMFVKLKADKSIDCIHCSACCFYQTTKFSKNIRARVYVCILPDLEFHFQSTSLFCSVSSFRLFSSLALWSFEIVFDLPKSQKIGSVLTDLSRDPVFYKLCKFPVFHHKYSPVARKVR